VGELTRGSAAARRRGIAALGACTAIGVASALLPAGGLGLPTCLFRAVTALPCPSCGLTRAFCALSHGHVADAVRLNAASPLVYAACAAILVLGAAQAVSGVDVLAPAWSRNRRAIVRVTFVAMSAAWAGNLLGVAGS
jgi:hypothetical protein